MGLLGWMRRSAWSHGIHPDDHKAQTSGKAIRRMAFPPQLVVPLAQHVGRPSRPIVRVGQPVRRGERIAEADGFMSVAQHAPATGVVEAIELRPLSRGEIGQAIVIRVCLGDCQTAIGNPRDIDALGRDELLGLIQDSGMVGLGGAAFPTHVKLSIKPEQTVDTLLVNGCECEPYLTCDHRTMLESSEDLIRGIRIALRITGAARAIIGIEDNKPDAIARLRALAQADGDIAVRAVPSFYPQGAEKILLKTLLGREVPSGGLIADVGATMQNVGTLAQLGRLLPRGEALIERAVTVAGPGMERPGNYIIPIGTPVGFVLKQVGFAGSSSRLVLGGPMMGQAVASLTVPIVKGSSGVLVMDAETVTQRPRRTYPCIRCGECLRACPLHLNPKELGLLSAKREYTLMAERFHLNDCFECGCCALVCPAAIPLVQHFRVAKAVNRRALARTAPLREAPMR